MNDNDSFGQWLKQARRRRDLTREALAELVSCATPTLAKIEQGSRRPSRELAALLIEALDVPPAERARALRLARAPLPDPQAEAHDVPQTGEPNTIRGARPGGSPRLPALPLAPTPLIGRAAEQTQVLQHLADPACRLLTLTGPGGVGKTRLALHIATTAQAGLRSSDLGAGFAHGVAWVDLAALSDESHIVRAIADAVGCALVGADAPDLQLLAWLRERQQLIVLDNLEHLLGAEGAVLALLAAIVRQAPGIRLLATSRERLRIQSEWVIDIEGLAYPDHRPPTAEDRRLKIEDSDLGAAEMLSSILYPLSSEHLSMVDVERYDAVLLFLARARQASAGFALTPANRQAVARICRLLEGMPLGIELAAAWTRSLTCQEIADEIAGSLDFLARADRDIPSRHHSMRAVFDHSWRLLSDVERQVLAALSIFRGGFTRAAVDAVCGELRMNNEELRKDLSDEAMLHSPFSILHLLASLADKSLIRARLAANGVLRYDLHELTRQYAADRLSADPIAQQAVAARHCHYYAALLQQRLPDLFNASRTAAFGALDPELDNLRQAWAWAVDQRDAAALGMMAQALQAICEDRGWLQEGVALFGQAARALRAGAKAAGVGPPDAQPVLGQVIGRHGYFLARCGQFVAARALLQESLALLKDGERSLALADTLVNLGFVAYQQGDYAAAHGWLREGVAIADALGVRFYHALGLSFLGMVALAQGQYDEARAWFEQALAIERANGQPRGLTIALSFLGRTALAQGRIAEARKLLRESLELSSRIRDRWGVGYIFHLLGALAQEQGDLTEAHYLQREAAEIFAALGERRAYGLALASLGDAALALADEAAARQAFVDVLRLAAPEQILPISLHALLGIAALEARGQREADAYMLLVVICQHPATDYAIRTRAEQARTEIAARLPAPIRLAVEQQAHTCTLDGLLAQLVIQH